MRTGKKNGGTDWQEKILLSKIDSREPHYDPKMVPLLPRVEKTTAQYKLGWIIGWIILFAGLFAALALLGWIFQITREVWGL